MTIVHSAVGNDSELTGIVGFAAEVLSALGSIGVGFLVLLETVFPPIPSEVILPLAGFLAQRGELQLWAVVVFSTIGSCAGAVVLYWLGHRLGQDRAIRLLSRLPLVDRSDFERASGWFARHGRSAIFFGRLIPGVRSLISLPAGAQSMPLVTFLAFTAAGSLVWNGALIGFGHALGAQYRMVERYSSALNWAVIAALVLAVLWLIIRRMRRPAAAE